MQTGKSLYYELSRHTLHTHPHTYPYTRHLIQAMVTITDTKLYATIHKAKATMAALKYTGQTNLL